MMRDLKVNRVGVLGLLFFCIISFLYRLLLPLGDEPDWTVRVYWLTSSNHSYFSPYFWFNDIIGLFDTDVSLCSIDAGVKSIWAFIPAECNTEYFQVLFRWLLGIFILLPLFFIITFRVFFISFMRCLRLNRSSEDWDRRLDAISLSLLFPGMLYYLGVLAEEQFFLVITLYVFLFWSFWVPIIFLLILLVSIDLGNSIVVYFFVISMLMISKVHFKGRMVFFASIILLLTFAFLMGYRFLDFFAQLSFISDDVTSKSNAMYKAFDNNSDEKYPVVLRPIITFMTFVFSTPSGVKVPILYLITGLFFLILSLKVLRRKDKILDCFWFVPIFSILFFVFLFPTYANAKYYIFVMPFFLYVALGFYSRKKIFLFFLASSCIVLLHLVLYRL